MLALPLHEVQQRQSFSWETETVTKIKREKTKKKNIEAQNGLQDPSGLKLEKVGAFSTAGHLAHPPPFPDPTLYRA